MVEVGCAMAVRQASVGVVSQKTQRHSVSTSQLDDPAVSICQADFHTRTAPSRVSMAHKQSASNQSRDCKLHHHRTRPQWCAAVDG